MRHALSGFVGAALFVAPGFVAAADLPTATHVVASPTPTPAPTPVQLLMPADRLRALPPPVSGPPVNPSTPTLWLKPFVDKQLILSNITESMSPVGSGKCMKFRISASLNSADAVTVLNIYSTNEVIKEARVYAPPSIVYTLSNAKIQSYSESDGASGASVTMTLIEQKFSVSAGSNSTTSDC